MLLTSIFRAYGSSTPTVFQACLTAGGTLIQVAINGAGGACPAGTTPVSWNQQGPAGPAGGLTAIRDITSSTSFLVPANVSHLMIEAWGGGGGGSSVNGCQAGNGGGSGGYARGIIAVTPGESLAIVVGQGGSTANPGTTTSVQRAGTPLVSASGGAAGGLTSGGSGGTGSAEGIIRAGNPGGDGTFDPMCQFGSGQF